MANLLPESASTFESADSLDLWEIYALDYGG